MVELAYDFKIHGVTALKSALRSVARSAAATNQRIMRSAGMTGAAARRGTVARGPAAAVAARKAAVDPAIALQKAQAKGHLVRLRQIEKEKAAAIRAANKEYQTRQRQEQRLAAKAQRQAAASDRARRATRAGMYGTAGRSAVGAARGIGRYALLGAGVMGGFAAGGAIRNATRVQRSAALLANQAYREEGGPSRAEWAAKVKGRARTLGAQTGLGAEGVIGGMRQFVALSGNVDAALKLSPLMSKLSVATGADIGDVGRTGGQIMAAMMGRNVPQAQAIAETEEIFRSMAAQAKLGSIEFKDLASNMGALISSTARFDGKISDLTATMGAVAQLAILGGASSPEEAMTSVKRFSDDLVQNAKRYEKMARKSGHKGTFFTDKNMDVLRGPEQIMMDVFRITKGSLPELKKLFGIRSAKGVEAITGVMSVARRVARGGAKEAGLGADAPIEAAIKAGKAQLARFQKARMSPQEVMQSFTAVMQTSSAKFEVAIEKFNQAVGTQLLPVIAQLIPQFEALVPAMAKAAELVGRFVKSISENPLRSVMQLMAAKVVADVAAAQIGIAVRNAILRSISVAPVPPGGGGGGVVPVGAAPAAGGAAATAAGGAAGKATKAGRWARLGTAGKVAVGGAAALALPATLAALATDAALEQVDKLGKEAGSKTSAYAALPGVNAKGEFDWGEAAKSLIPGYVPLKAGAALTQIGSDVVNQEDTRNAAAGRPVAPADYGPVPDPANVDEFMASMSSGTATLGDFFAAVGQATKELAAVKAPNRGGGKGSPTEPGVS